MVCVLTSLNITTLLFQSKLFAFLYNFRLLEKCSIVLTFPLFRQARTPLCRFASVHALHPLRHPRIRTSTHPPSDSRNKVLSRRMHSRPTPTASSTRKRWWRVDTRIRDSSRDPIRLRGGKILWWFVEKKSNYWLRKSEIRRSFFG